MGFEGTFFKKELSLSCSLVLVYTYVLTAFLQRPIAFDSTGVLGRITCPDLVMFVLVLLDWRVLLQRNFSSVRIASLIWIFLFFCGMVFSENPEVVFVEVVAHLFLVISFFCIVGNVTSVSILLKIVWVFLLSGCLAGIVGVHDSIAYSIGNDLLMEKPEGYNVVGASTFRNYGQAGNYCMNVILVACASLMAGVNSKVLNIRLRSMALISSILCVVLLFLASKVAAIVGTLSGVLVMAFANRIFFKKKLLTFKTVCLVLGVVFSLNLVVSFSGDVVYNRISKRFIERVKSEKGGEGFTYQNWSDALRAFQDNPVWGTGLGAFEGQYNKYEVHSTYLKMLGEAGAFGFLSFSLLLYVIFRKIPVKAYVRSNTTFRFYLLLGYGILGSSVAWFYTYEFRKREFWIILAVFLLSYRFRRNEKVGNE